MQLSRPSAKTVKKKKSTKGSGRAVPSADQAEKERVRRAKGMREAYGKLDDAQKAEYRWRKAAAPGTPRKGSSRSLVARNVDVATAFCDWSDIDEVVRIYTAAAIMSELTALMSTCFRATASILSRT